MSGNELPKIINKTQADIDTVIAAIQGTDLPDNIKEFTIACIRLAVWLPKAVLQRSTKITLALLRK